jgi:hypothetical protein
VAKLAPEFVDKVDVPGVGRLSGFAAAGGPGFAATDSIRGTNWRTAVEYGVSDHAAPIQSLLLGTAMTEERARGGPSSCCTLVWI